MKTTIIFDPFISGHHLEYLAHLWSICARRPNNKYVFLVSPEFNGKRDLHRLLNHNNITVQSLTEDEIIKCSGTRILVRAFNVANIIKHYIRLFSASNVFAINVMDFLPFFPFIAPKKVRVSGIIYGIYLYGWAKSSFLMKIENVCKYTLFAKSRVFNQVFVLNDFASARLLNRIYKTNRFVGLPDPYLPVQALKGLDIRSKYGIPDDKTIFIHFGSLGVRKGSLLILKSLELLSEDEADKYAFIFAGSIPQTVSEQFYKMFDYLKVQKSIRIYVEDSFCEYSFFASLCEQCDSILMPYLDTYRSSGIIGYASQFSKPVVAPSSGLIGKLVKKYRLGLLLKCVDEINLRESYASISNHLVDMPNDDYCKSHTVCDFTDAIVTAI